MSSKVFQSKALQRQWGRKVGAHCAGAIFIVALGATVSAGCASVPSDGEDSEGDGGSPNVRDDETNEVCSPDPSGTCEPLPAVCGSPDDYENGVEAYTSGDDEGGRSAAIVLGLAGNDDLATYSEGSCVLGGTGDDVLRSDYEPVNGPAGRDILVGGSGADRFVSGATGRLYPIIVDLEVTDIIQISNLTLPESGFFEVTPGFEGTNEEIENKAVRVVFDPEDGTLWKYEEQQTSNSWLPVFEVANFKEVSPKESQIITGSFLD